MNNCLGCTGDRCERRPDMPLDDGLRDFLIGMCNKEDGFIHLDKQYGTYDDAPIYKASSRKPNTASKIGTRLHAIFQREYNTGPPCGPCRAAMVSLDKMTPAEARDSIEDIVDDIASRAMRNAPRWWQKIGIVIDDVLHTGITKMRIREHVLEAIEDNEDWSERADDP